MILLIILLAVLGVCAYLVYEHLQGVDDEYAFLYEIEEAYKQVIKTQDIRYILPYATIPLSLSLSNKIRLEMSTIRGNIFTKSETVFEYISEDHVSYLYKRMIIFGYDKEGLPLGTDMEEYWWIDKITTKLKRVSKELV